MGAKLNAILGAAIVAAAFLSFFLLGSLSELDRGYRGILQNQVREQSLAREMQVAFKKQVQEWKNILLRGAIARDRARYVAQFGALRTEVMALTDSLEAGATSDTLHAEIRAFRRAYLSLDTAYTGALARFEAADGRNPFQVDSLVRGQDRAPTDQIDGIVAQLEREVQRLVSAQGALVEEQRRGTLAALLVLIAVLAAVPFLAREAIVRPIRRLEEASARIAAGDLSVEIAHRSRDEIGDLADSFRRMRDALRAVVGDIARSSATMSATAHELADGSAQVNAAMLEVAQAAQGIATAAGDQITSVAQALDASQAVAVRAQHIALEGERTEASARAVEARTQSGRQAMSIVAARLDEVSAAAAETAPALQALTTKSHGIRAFTDAVASIATQSKLLALNAAIEAARAAEHGRGFGVVADEVGKLARDSEAALAHIRALAIEIESTGVEIGQRLDRVKGAVSEGRSAFSDSAAVFEAVDEEAHHSSEAATRIGRSTVEQRERAQHLSEVVSALASTAEENAATAEQLSALNEEQAAGVHRIAGGARGLRELAAHLDAAIGQFKL